MPAHEREVAGEHQELLGEVHEGTGRRVSDGAPERSGGNAGVPEGGSAEVKESLVKRKESATDPEDVPTEAE